MARIIFLKLSFQLPVIGFVVIVQAKGLSAYLTTIGREKKLALIPDEQGSLVHEQFSQQA